MPSKPIELPPETASRQLFALKQHFAGKLRIHDVNEMFEAMKDLRRP